MPLLSGRLRYGNSTGSRAVGRVGRPSRSVNRDVCFSCRTEGWREDPADFGKPEAIADTLLLLPNRGLAGKLARHSRVRRLLEFSGVCRVNPEAFEYPLGGRITERR